MVKFFTSLITRLKEKFTKEVTFLSLDSPNLKNRHLKQAIALLKSETKLAFLPWEEKIIRLIFRDPSERDKYNLGMVLAIQGRKLLGISLFGDSSDDDCATINHFCVAKKYRGTGLADDLVHRTLDLMRSNFLYLMVMPDNRRANDLFSRADRLGINDLGFLQCDIEPIDPAETTSECRSYNDLIILGLRALLLVVPYDKEVWSEIRRALQIAGVLRVHFLIPENITNSELTLMKSYGFTMPQGETLWVRTIEESTC